MVPPARQATFEYSFIPAEPMGGRPFGLVINLNYKDSAVSARVCGEHPMERWSPPSLCPLLLLQGNLFQDAVFNQTVTITEKEDGLDGETWVQLLPPSFSPVWLL